MAKNFLSIYPVADRRMIYKKLRPRIMQGRSVLKQLRGTTLLDGLKNRPARAPCIAGEAALSRGLRGPASDRIMRSLTAQKPRSLLSAMQIFPHHSLFVQYTTRIPNCKLMFAKKGNRSPSLLFKAMRSSLCAHVKIGSTTAPWVRIQFIFHAMAGKNQPDVV